MKQMKSLPLLNCLRRPGRSAALMLISFFLCFAILAGSLLIEGLQDGMASLDARLGADIMVVPYEAVTKSELDDMILQGNPGYFYMDESVTDKIKNIEGIEKYSEQTYLVTTAASCCSYKVQIIGFDPETDFTITPWVESSYSGELGYMEVFVGCDLSAFAGDTLTFFGSDVKVAARLEETGTYLDTAVYASDATIKTLVEAAYEKQIYDFGMDPDSLVSCVMIDVDDDYVIEDVMNDINIHVRKVEAVRTSSMVEDVADKLGGISTIAGVMLVVIWLLVLVILILAYAMIAGERRKEFAVLRLLGASRGRLGGLLLRETLVISAAGSILGALMALLCADAFSGAIEDILSMPFLLPSLPSLLLLSAAAAAVAVLASSASAAVSAYRISRTDAALILRGDNG